MTDFRWLRYGDGRYKSLLGSIVRDDRGWTWTPPSHIGGLTRGGYRTLSEAKFDAGTEMSDWWWPE